MNETRTHGVAMTAALRYHRERDVVETSTPKLRDFDEPLPHSCSIELTRPPASTLIWSVARRLGPVAAVAEASLMS